MRKCAAYLELYGTVEVRWWNTPYLAFLCYIFPVRKAGDLSFKLSVMWCWPSVLCMNWWPAKSGAHDTTVITGGIFCHFSLPKYLISSNRAIQNKNNSILLITRDSLTGWILFFKILWHFTFREKIVNFKRTFVICKIHILDLWCVRY